MNNVDRIFENEAFNCLDENLKSSLKSLYINIKGKSTDMAIPYVIGFIKTMPKDVKLTAEQKNAIFAVMTADMSDRERRNVLNMLAMFGFKWNN